MEAHAEEMTEMTVPAGKLRQLSSGKWYLRCKWCDQEFRPEADLTEDEAYGMLEEWRLSMPKRQEKYRFWACFICKEWYKEDKKETTTDTAEAASSQLAHAAVTDAAAEADDLKSQVQQLKEEINGLKEEVGELKAEVQQHVAYRTAHDEEIRKLKQEVDKLTAEVTAAQNPPPAIRANIIGVARPDEPPLHEC